MNEEAVTRGRDQHKVCDYLQTEGAAIFEFAVPRLNYLFRRATYGARSRRLCVLNIGIGTGWLQGRCNDAGWTTFAVDPSLAAARELAGVEALPFQDGAFDVVFSSEVFEHLPDDLLEQGSVRSVGCSSPTAYSLAPSHTRNRWSDAERYARAAASSIMPAGTIKASPPGTLRKYSHRRD
jgi:hypothetical protein